MAYQSSFERVIAKWKAEGGPLRIMSASGQLGYGVIEKAFRAGLERDLHLIGADMGSVDPGPYYLGAGKLATARRSTKRDLKMLLTGAVPLKIPIVIGTAGTGGGDTHLEQTLEIIREIAREEGLNFRLATIRSEMPRDLIKRQAKAGKVSSIGPIPELTDAEIDGAACIVGQAGTEAFVRAIDLNPDVIVAGRACDTAIYTCLPEKLGFPMGPACQMAKIIECASLACEGGGRNSMLGTLEGESFILESMNPNRRATPMSVAAHGLYEQADPLSVAEPEGVLYLDDFEVRGARRAPLPRLGRALGSRPSSSRSRSRAPRASARGRSCWRARPIRSSSRRPTRSRASSRRPSASWCRRNLRTPTRSTSASTAWAWWAASR